MKTETNKASFGVEPKVENSLPYVVSGDIKTLLGQWAESSGFRLPEDTFFDSLRSDFCVYMKSIFPGFEFIDEQTIVSRMKQIMPEKKPLLSLDPVYSPSDLTIGVTRVRKANGEGGIGRRSQTPPLLRQFRDLRRLRASEVDIADDVIFGGDVLKRVGRVVKKMGIQIGTIYAGVGIGSGVQKLRDAGYPTECAFYYPKAIDEICERDFYPGVPMSGRLIDPELNIGAPYVLPFGDPGEWASIPTGQQVPFSKFCLSQTEKLFQGIEQASSKIVTCKDLSRGVVGLPRDDTRFVDVLKNVKL